MFIFNKYVKAFNFKNQSLKNESLFFNYSFNYKNNIIHSVLFFISLNLYFYLFDSVLYKNSLKTLVSFNPFLLFFISKKSFQKVTNY
jgi:hypothetical protein